MQPDPSTPSRQGTGTENDKTGKTVPEDQIPEDNRQLEGIQDPITEDAIPPGETVPQAHHLQDRPERRPDRERR